MYPTIVPYFFLFDQSYEANWVLPSDAAAKDTPAGCAIVSLWAMG